MNTVLENLWKQLKSAGPSARWAIAAIVGAMLLVSGVVVYRANNPHFVVLAADLDSPTFNRAVTALAGAGIRYETSLGPPPHMIQVEEGRKYDAMQAVHLSGEYLGASRGISSGLDGSSSVFLGQTERHQRSQKRLWEEAEMQLEGLNYVTSARVTVSGVESSPLSRLRQDNRRASVVLKLSSLALPTATETRGLVGIVRGTTGVPDERITIVNQHSDVLFDGGAAGGIDSLIALEERFARERTGTAQSLLDRSIGPGLTVVSVNGSWREIREESISETLDPAKKPRSQRSRTTEEPEWPRSVGGPAGVAANTQEGSDSLASSNGTPPGMATTSEEETSYTFGSRTTHTVAQPHQLERLSISLVIDASKGELEEDAEALVKEAVGFNEERGDTIETRVVEIPGLERDADGVPVLPEPVEAPAPADPMLTMALEYGLELLAGLAFLFVLLKSLRNAKSSATSNAKGGEVSGQGGRAGRTGGRVAGPDGTPVEVDEEVDLDALARAHVEELLQNEPEKVSALLSRWALAEEHFVESGSR